MKISFQRDGYEYVITNEHTGASYGQPVLLADGKVTDTRVKYEPDEPPIYAGVEKGEMRR